jgi:hypothetical protein
MAASPVFDPLGDSPIAPPAAALDAPGAAPSSALADARAAVQRVVATLTDAATEAHLSLQQGKALEAVAVQARNASSYLTAVASDSDVSVPVDRTLTLLSQTLTSLAAVLETAQAYDTEHGISVGLYHRVEEGVRTAAAAVTAARERAAAASAAAGHSVDSATEPLQHAYTALQDLAKHLTAPAATAVASATTTVTATTNSVLSTPAVVAARGLVSAAVDEVGKSVTHLRGAPLTEVPLVASLEALHLARTALAAVTTAVGSAVEATGASTALLAARDRAATAVADATTQVSSLRSALAARALAVANTGVAIAVNKAAALDRAYLVSERVAALSDSYHIPEHLASAKTTALTTWEEVDRNYKVTQAVAATLESLREADSTYAGGRVSALATTAVAAGDALAAAALRFVRSVQTQYVAAKAAQDASTGAPAGEPATATAAAAPAPLTGSEATGSPAVPAKVV